MEPVARRKTLTSGAVDLHMDSGVFVQRRNHAPKVRVESHGLHHLLEELPPHTWVCSFLITEEKHSTPPTLFQVRVNVKDGAVII
jgi:hypothetical protein